jgi:hypothetical protein
VNGGRAGLRGLAGGLTGGMVVLALVLVAAALVADRRGTPGPGAVTLAVHLVAAGGLVALQRWSDRRPDGSGAAGAGAVVAISAAVLAAQWLV